MTKLSSIDLYKQVTNEGVEYLPSDRQFFNTYPWKIIIKPKYPDAGFGGTAACYLSLRNEKDALKKLNEFSKRVKRTIKNIQQKEAIRESLNGFNEKIRWNSECQRTTLYIKTADDVAWFFERHKNDINSIFGPIGDKHEDELGELNKIVRDRLYYDRYRYKLIFECSSAFLKKCYPSIQKDLNDLDKKAFRWCSLDWAQSMKRYRPSFHFDHQNIILFLEDSNDYVYLKLFATDFIKSSHEVILYDELK